MTKPSHPELTPERLAHLAEARQQIATGTARFGREGAENARSG